LKTSRASFEDQQVSFQKPAGFISKTSRFHFKNQQVSFQKPAGFSTKK